MNIVIIGGGLSGLTLAYLLKKENRNVTLLEASSRLGGRIQTIRGPLDSPLELGATWFSEAHINLLNLIEVLGLQKYPQYSKGISLFQTKSFEPPQKFIVPEAEQPSYRLVGGTQQIIDALVAQLDSKTLMMNSKVLSLNENGNQIEIEIYNKKKLYADKAIICLPPQLAGSSIKFSPQLPHSLTSILPTVQTWMSGSIKFVLEYDQPFWRKKGYSGMLYSHVGTIVEMYDHTNFEENKFGFTGFLSGNATHYTLKTRKELVLKQLSELIGTDAMFPKLYLDKIWSDEFVLAENQLMQRPHQNNGHPVLKHPYMNDKLFFSGTETATQFAGYMEGAVISAMEIAQYLKKN
jgi:monoamine oxidase